MYFCKCVDWTWVDNYCNRHNYILKYDNIYILSFLSRFSCPSLELLASLATLQPFVRVHEKNSSIYQSIKHYRNLHYIYNTTSNRFFSSIDMDIVVLTRRGMRTFTNVYLTALAVADLIYLVCVLWLSLRHYPYVNESVVWSYIYSHVWPYCVWLADATSMPHLFFIVIEKHYAFDVYIW